jgi:hypothetical protein
MPHPEPHFEPRRHPEPHAWPQERPRGHSLADRATRATAMATVAGLAALAGYTSYSHMRALAERVGEHGVDAHAFPLTVDGLDLIGVLVLLADRRTGRASGWLPWAVLTVGTLASIAANVAVAPPNPIARGISGWSAIALLAAAKLLAHLLEPAPASAAAVGDVFAHLGHTYQPSVIFDAPSVAAPAQPTGPTTPGGANPDPPPEPAATQPAGADTPAADAARRLPSGEAALQRWRHIWTATRHLDHATADTAATHGVSLRTLQFIRAAGQAGHLPTADSPPPTAIAAGPPPPAGHPPAPVSGPAGTASPAPLELAGLP